MTISPGSTFDFTVDETFRARYELAWQVGKPLTIESCLPPEDDACFAAAAEELVRLEIEHCWADRRPPPDARSDELPVVEHYLQRFPDLAERSIVRRLVQHEFHIRKLQEPDADPNEYVRRFPEIVSSDDLLESEPDREVDLPSIPGFHFRGVLGRGGMGVVYLADQRGLDRLVAVKMLKGATARDADAMRGLRAEAMSVAALQHPNVVQVHDIGDHDDRVYVVLEYVPGGSLAEYLRRRPRGADEASRMVETLSRAVHQAHSVGIVHRDLKPSNVLLMPDGTPKISDFGLAMRTTSQERSPADADMIVGTPSYMAPEQARRDGTVVGPAADVHALGAILYEMLTGRPPYLAADAWQTIAQVVLQTAVPASQLNASVPRDLDTICNKCLSKDPSRRYSTALALADDLRRYLNDEPISARPVGSIERVWRWSRRNKRTAVWIGAFVAALLAGTILSLTMWRLSEGHRRRAESSYAQARRAVDDCYTMAAESPIFQAPGMQPAQHMLLTATLNYYREFLDTHQDDASAQIQLGLTRVKLANIQVELGRLDSAERDFVEAESLLDPLSTSGASWILRQEAWKAHNNHGALLGRLGRWKEAERQHGSALRIAQQLRDDFPDRDSLTRHVGTSYHNLGFVAERMGDRVEAETYFRRALEIRRRAAAGGDPDEAALRDVARTLNSFGVILQATGRWDDAESAFQDATKRLEELIETGGENTALALSVSSHANLGRLHLMRGRSEIARTYTTTAWTRADQLVRSDPEVEAYLLRRSRLEFQLAVIAQSMGSMPDASKWASAALDSLSGLRDSAASEDATTVRIGATAISADSDAARLHSQATIEELGSTLRELETTTDLASASPDLLYAIGCAWGSYGNARLETDRLDEARSAHLRAAEIFQRLVARFPDDLQAQLQLAVTWHNLGVHATLTGDSTNELAAYRQAKQMRQTLLDRLPQNRELAEQLATDHYGEAGGLDRLGSDAESLLSYEAAIDLLTELHSNGDSTISSRDALMRSYQGAFRVTLKLHDARVALRMLEGQSELLAESKRPSAWLSLAEHGVLAVRYLQAQSDGSTPESLDALREFGRGALNRAIECGADETLRSDERFQPLNFP